MTAVYPKPFQPGPRLISGTDLNTQFGNPIVSVDNTVTALGTNRATAYAVKAAITNLTTVAASTGAVLPVGVVGATYILFNAGASPLTVYAPGSMTIDGTAGSTGVALANAKRCEYICVSATAYVSAQLGAVSA